LVAAQPGTGRPGGGAPDRGRRAEGQPAWTDADQQARPRHRRAPGRCLHPRARDLGRAAPPDRRAGDRGRVMPAAMVGPTASGKTEASLSVAPALGAEILSVDSMVVYRGMDVGTAKPTPAERAAVPHHLIDVADPAEPFSVAEYQRLAREALAGV